MAQKKGKVNKFAARGRQMGRAVIQEGASGKKISQSISGGKSQGKGKGGKQK